MWCVHYAVGDCSGHCNSDQDQLLPKRKANIKSVGLTPKFYSSRLEMTFTPHFSQSDVSLTPFIVILLHLSFHDSST